MERSACGTVGKGKTNSTKNPVRMAGACGNTKNGVQSGAAYNEKRTPATKRSWWENTEKGWSLKTP